MAGRASIVGAAVTHVGNVREHNEDAHYFDADLGLFIVCDGMGGHAAGEVASAIAIKTVRERWSEPDTQEVADVWLARGTAIAKKQLIDWLREGVLAAHNAIISEAVRDPTKGGMGTTLIGAIIVGSEIVFAHAGDSRAYIVRDGIAMQLTEDHTLLQRLLAAGIEVDVTGDGARFRSMLTNALGIGQECKVSTFVVPLADGDRFLLCSDGVSEYVPEHEVGEVLSKQPSPARAAQKLVDLALERGGHDNATAVVVRVLEAGESPVPSEQRRRDDLSISLCDLWTERVSPQQRLRALRISIPRDHSPGEKLPAHTLGDRVAWIVVEGEVNQDGEPLGPGAFIYPDSLVAGTPVPDKDSLAVARTEVRAIALRNDDFRELCEDEPELGEILQESLAAIIASTTPKPRPKSDSAEVAIDRAIERATTSPPPIAKPAPDIDAVPQSVIDEESSVGADAPPDEDSDEPEISISAEASGPEDDGSDDAEIEISQPDEPDDFEPEIEVRPVRAVANQLSELEMEFAGADEREHVRAKRPSDGVEQLVISRDDGRAKVIEKVTDDDDQTLTLTVEEPSRTKPVTPEDGDEISGTIDSPVNGTPMRSKRASEGWDE